MSRCLIACAVRRIAVIVGFATAGSVLNLIENENRTTLLFLGCLIFPRVFVQPSLDIDERAFLQLHLFDAIDDRAKALYGIIEPSCVVLGLRIIDLLADAESYRRGRVITSGDTDGGFVVISSGNDDLGCKYL